MSLIVSGCFQNVYVFLLTGNVTQCGCLPSGAEARAALPVCMLHVTGGWGGLGLPLPIPHPGMTMTTQPQEESSFEGFLVFL